MKLFRLTLFTLLLACCQAMAQQANFGNEITAKLNSYSLEDVKADTALRNNNQGMPRMEALDNDLAVAVNYYKKHPLTEDGAAAILRAILLAQAFDSAAGGDALSYVIPLYDQKTTVFKKALMRLHPEDRKILQDWIPLYCRRNCG